MSLKLYEYTPKQFDDHDVDIRITHCGVLTPSKNALTLFKVCGSDLHTVRSGWVYPLDFDTDLGTNNLSGSSRP
jgi:D-arabinose 1-dehydrogenase-like Zn-dependent alcohol dehydrogenase